MLRMNVGTIEKSYYDIDDEFFLSLFPLLQQVSITAMESAEAPWALYKAVEHIVRHRIEGDLVECGVWRGGSMMLACSTMVHLGDTSRHVYLYDTFSGMPRPDAVDVAWDGTPAMNAWAAHAAQGTNWGYGGSVDMVRQVLGLSHYPEDRMIFVEGLVEETIPAVMPERISLLRLDTDFYASTLHELRHLYPRLVSGGILIIDDYGYFRGAKQAVDEYFAENGDPIFLARINESVRLAVKP